MTPKTHLNTTNSINESSKYHELGSMRHPNMHISCLMCARICSESIWGIYLCIPPYKEHQPARSHTIINFFYIFGCRYRCMHHNVVSMCVSTTHMHHTVVSMCVSTTCMHHTVVSMRVSTTHMRHNVVSICVFRTRMRHTVVCMCEPTTRMHHNVVSMCVSITLLRS